MPWGSRLFVIKTRPFLRGLRSSYPDLKNPAFSFLNFQQKNSYLYVLFYANQQSAHNENPSTYRMCNIEQNYPYKRQTCFIRGAFDLNSPTCVLPSTSQCNICNVPSICIKFLFSKQKLLTNSLPSPAFLIASPRFPYWHLSCFCLPDFQGICWIIWCLHTVPLKLRKIHHLVNCFFHFIRAVVPFLQLNFFFGLYSFFQPLVKELIRYVIFFIPVKR